MQIQEHRCISFWLSIGLVWVSLDVDIDDYCTYCKKFFYLVELPSNLMISF